MDQTMPLDRSDDARSKERVRPVVHVYEMGVT